MSLNEFFVNLEKLVKEGNLNEFLTSLNAFLTKIAELILGVISVSCVLFEHKRVKGTSEKFLLDYMVLKGVRNREAL